MLGLFQTSFADSLIALGIFSNPRSTLLNTNISAILEGFFGNALGVLGGIAEVQKVPENEAGLRRTGLVLKDAAGRHSLKGP